MTISFSIFLSLIVTILGICDSSVCLCSGSICTSCIHNTFYYNTSTSSCQLCGYNCLQCSNSTYCTQCASNYYLNSSRCALCKLYCAQCISQNSCVSCIDKYVLVNNQCIFCKVHNVLKCEQQFTVSLCMDGFWKNGDSCSPCRQFCQKCTSSSNCLKCNDGFRTEISAGTYCTSCKQGCKVCTKQQCLECKDNYKMLSGSCTSIQNECNSIQNCLLCHLIQGRVQCKACQYPYFLSNKICLKGSSLLCTNGAIGLQPYHCTSCAPNSYQVVRINSQSKQTLCYPKVQLIGTDITQNFITTTNYEIFQPSLRPYQHCQDEYIYTNIFKNGQNILTYNTYIQPYYKLYLLVKSIPIFKNTKPTAQVNLQINMIDNSTNSFKKIINFNSSQPCQPFYFNVTSRHIKDQQISIQFKATIKEQQVSIFPNGLIGYKQILINIYRCSTECRICSNSRYCIECYGNLFESNHQCVDNCFGLYEFYSPIGDPENYSSKSCRQQCPQKFYASSHPTKSSIQICSACSGTCITCRSINQCLSCQSPLLLFVVNSTCIQVCPPTHYNVSGNCQICNPPCRTCLNQSHCLSCSIGYYYINSCVGICQNGTYANLFNKSCDLCTNNCQNCLNSASYCLSCLSPYKLLGHSCQLNCPLTTHYAVGSLCQSCSSPCSTCLSASRCLSCSNGYLYNQSCLSQCPNGLYSNIPSKSCNVCINNCSSCSSESICTSCLNNTYLYKSQCLMQCPNRTYANQINICIPCLRPCLICLDVKKCLSCQIGYLSKQNIYTCVTRCQLGYYSNNTNLSCLQCSQKCLTCLNNASNCQSCHNNTVLQSNQCVQMCSQGFFNRSNLCVKCTYPCLNCKNSGSLCISCHSPYILNNDTCLSQCLLNQFEYNAICQLCLSPCSSCTSKTTCLSCQLSTLNQSYLLLDACVLNCPDKMYADKSSRKCRNCSFPCQNCLDNRRCLSCSNGYLNVEKKTCQICQTTYYAEQSTRQCRKCNLAIPNCQICTNINNCVLCEQSFYLHLSTTCINASSCRNISTFYVNEQQRTCKNCVLPCGNCTNDNKCTSCINGYLEFTGCVFSCRNAYYADTQTKMCLSCHNICKTCHNNAKNCLTCHLDGSYPFIYAANKTCISDSQCKDGYYIDNLFGYKRCLKCQPPCLTCSSISTCLSCLNGILFGSSCGFSCPQSYYISNKTISATCQKCQSNCQHCIHSGTNCISCPSTQYLQNNTCVEACAQSYYLNTNILQCKKCRQPCQTCISSTYCNSCQNSSQILYFGQCINLCPDGTFNNSGNCLQCPSECQLCLFNITLNSTICIKCQKGLFMNSRTSNCLSNCQIIQYPDVQTRSCYSCQIPCYSCKSATSCLSCIQNYLYYNQQCLSDQYCPVGTYKHPQQPNCLDQCPQLYWGDPFRHQCQKQCLYNYLKWENQCINRCPQHTSIGFNFHCNKCMNNNCSQLLSLSIDSKSIFNNLYLRLSFSLPIPTHKISKQQISLQINPLQQNTNRLLQESSKINFDIKQYSSNTIWLQLKINKSLKSVELKLYLLDYYIFPGYIIQSINETIILHSFDYYTLQQQKIGQFFRWFSQSISIIMCLLLLCNLILNNSYVLYQMLDYYQLLFMFLFIGIDYPPILNHYFYGYRFAHYLFLPQIFRTNNQNYTQATPNKFAVINGDVNFLKNIGHGFIIIIITISVIIIMKFIQLIINCKNKNNRIENQFPNEKSNSNHQETNINNHLKNNNLNYTPKNYENKNNQINSNIDEIIQNKIVEDKLTNQNNQIFLTKYLKIIISRFKWNYFNDICYTLYLYLVVAAYSQIYDFKIYANFDYISNLFAVIFMILCLGFPILLIILLYKNQQQIIQSYPNTLLHLKCFYNNLKVNSLVSLMYIPIHYIKKLLFGLLIVFFPQQQNFILGIVIALGLLTIVLIIVYRPYRCLLDLYTHILFEALLTLACIIICIMQLQSIDLNPQQKMQAAFVAVVITMLLAVLLVIYNVILSVNEITKTCIGKDILINYSDTNNLQEQKSNNTPLQQQSNIRLQKENTLKTNIWEKKQSQQSDESDLNIYLKKQIAVPTLLIKCYKKPQQQQQQQQQSVKYFDSQEVSQISQKNNNIIQKKYQNTQRPHKNHKQYFDEKQNYLHFYQNNNIYKEPKVVKFKDYQEEEESND